MDFPWILILLWRLLQDTTIVDDSMETLRTRYKNGKVELTLILVSLVSKNLNI